MSSIEVRCPGCNSSYRVSGDAVGKRGRCKRCGQSFVLQSAIDTCDWARSDTDADNKAEGSSNTRLPENIGRFEVKQQLGKGGFGTVYRAYDPILEREVAIKVPHPHLLNSVNDRQRYLREAKTAARLRHAHIVPLFEATIDGDKPYIASAFIEGQSLDAVLRDRRPEIAESVGWVIKLARAIDYAHGQGIIHRDIKPGNIMLDVHDEPLLMDFGLARVIASDEQLTQADSVLGTPAYMSPEQAAGRIHEITPATDQYSLGVLLYELISGQRPFSGPVGLVISLVINASAPPPSEHNAQVSGDLEAICLRMMSKQIGDRYSSLGDVAVELERYLERSRESVVASDVAGSGTKSTIIQKSDALPQIIASLPKSSRDSGKTKKNPPPVRPWARGTIRQVHRPAQASIGPAKWSLTKTAVVAAVLTVVLVPLSLSGLPQSANNSGAIDDVVLHQNTGSRPPRVDSEGISVVPLAGNSDELPRTAEFYSVSLRSIDPSDVVAPDEAKNLQDFFEFSHPTDLPSLECLYVEMPIRQGRRYSLVFGDNEVFPVFYARFATEDAFFVPKDRPQERLQELTVLSADVNQIEFVALGDADKAKCFFKFYYDENVIKGAFNNRELTLAEYP